VHSGIHTGLVVLREGDGARGRIEAVGHTTGVAARLAATAARDEILVSEQSIGPGRYRFRLGSTKNVVLDRAGESVSAVSVLGPASAPINRRMQVATRRVPFVGRVGELTEWSARLGQAVAGVGQRVALFGPAGQGKTRLAEEIAGLAVGMGFATFYGSCSSGPMAGVLQPFRQLAAAMLDRSPNLSIHLALQAVATQECDRKSPADEFARAFIEWAGSTPLLLVCDDWQAADSASIQLLQRLVGSPGRFALLLVTREIAARVIPFEGCDVEALPPLELDQSCELVRHCAPQLDPIEASRIHFRAGGNPLYIEELCHLPLAHHPEPRAIGHGRGHAGWLGALIASRFAQLPEAAADALQTAAVLGSEFPLWLFEASAGQEQAKGLADLIARDFLLGARRPGWMRFKHGIAWEVVYSLVPLRTRSVLHARIAAEIEARADTAGIDRDEALAWHYAACRAPAEAALAAERAGDAAARLRSLDRAQLHYRAAIAALDQLPITDERYASRTSLMVRFGMVVVFNPEPSHLEVFSVTIALAEGRGDWMGAAQARFWAGYLCYALGDGRLSARYCREAIDQCRLASDSPFVVQVRATLGQAEALLGHYDEALVLLNDAIAIKSARRSGQQPSLGCAYSLTSLASVLGDMGRFAAAREALAAALEMMSGEHHPVEASIHDWAGAIALWQGRPAEALREAASARAVATRVEAVYLHAMSRAITGYAQWLLTGDEEAVHALSEAVACMMEGGRKLALSVACGWLADAEVGRGDIPAARRAIAGTLAQARSGDRLGEAMAARAAARVYAGNLRRSELWLRRARLVARMRQAPREEAATDLVEAELRLARHQPEHAVVLLARASTAFKTMEMPWFVDRASDLMAQAQARAGHR
jgi:tetratricopeptide (TPR) repeat protein